MALGTVGHTGQSGKLRTGRTSRNCDALRVDAIFSGMFPGPADGGLDIVESGGIKRLRDQTVFDRNRHITLGRDLLCHRHLQTLIAGIPATAMNHKQCRICLVIVRTENIDVKITTSVGRFRKSRIDNVAIFAHPGGQCRLSEGYLRMIFADFPVSGICRERGITRNFRNFGRGEKRSHQAEGQRGREFFHGDVID